MEIKITTPLNRRNSRISFLGFILKRNFSVLSFLFLFFLSSYSSSAQIAVRGTFQSSTTVTSLSLTINKPTAVVTGDVMIVNIATQGNNVAPTLSGWTSISSSALSSTSRNGAVLYKVATSTEPASYTFALGTSATNASGAIVAFYNVDVSGASPFDVPTGTISSANSATATATADSTDFSD